MATRVSRRKLLLSSIFGVAFSAAPGAITSISNLTVGRAFAQNLAVEKDPIKYYWNKKLSELASVEPFNCSDEDKERHQIYCAVVFSILYGYFNGNRRGEVGEYPMRAKQKASGLGTNSRYSGGYYFGHNICAIAVDEDGEIIDFDFNNAELLNDSTQHAEVRLIRRLFSLADAYEKNKTDTLTSVAADMHRDYNKTLNNITIYTSMESCAQCSGMMTLANIPKVVYLQSDPTQYQIGKIMFRLSRPVGQMNGGGAPRPISGKEIGFMLTDKIDKSYEDYRSSVGSTFPKQAFYKPPGSESDSSRWNITQSITSFVCTDVAMDHFADGRALLNKAVLKYPDFRPVLTNTRQTNQKIFSNNEVLNSARNFVEYSLTKGKRGISR